MFSRKSGGMGGYAEYAFSKSRLLAANLYLRRAAAADRQRGYRHLCVGYNELFGAALTPLQISAEHPPYCGDVPSQTLAARVLPDRSSSVTVWGVIIPVDRRNAIIGWFWF